MLVILIQKTNYFSYLRYKLETNPTHSKYKFPKFLFFIQKSSLIIFISPSPIYTLLDTYVENITLSKHASDSFTIQHKGLCQLKQRTKLLITINDFYPKKKFHTLLAHEAMPLATLEAAPSTPETTPPTAPSTVVLHATRMDIARLPLRAPAIILQLSLIHI